MPRQRRCEISHVRQRFPEVWIDFTIPEALFQGLAAETAASTPELCDRRDWAGQGPHLSLVEAHGRGTGGADRKLSD